MAGQPQLPCSTGAFTRDPDQTDYRAILIYGPMLAVAGFELLFYPDWYPDIEGIAAALRASGLRFPVLHAEKSIGPALGSDQPEVRALGLQWLAENYRLGRLLGTTLLILHLWGLPGSDERLDRNLAALDACLTMADGYGMSMAVETIPCVRADPLSNVRRALDHDARCLVALDTEFLALHQQLEPALTAPWLWERASVAHVHVKDYDGRMVSADGRRRYLHPGDGHIDCVSVFGALSEHAFSGFVSLEAAAVDRTGAVAMGRIQASIASLRDLMSRYNDNKALSEHEC